MYRRCPRKHSAKPRRVACEIGLPLDNLRWDGYVEACGRPLDTPGAAARRNTEVIAVPAKDIYHACVRNALLKEGWTITHDPYTITFGQKDVFVDLGAERLVAAEKGGERIAVEIKSFQGASDIRDLEMALGQYVFYRSLLTRMEPGRKLFLAIPQSVFVNTLQEPIARPVLIDQAVALIAFDPEQEVIVQWTM